MSHPMPSTTTLPADHRILCSVCADLLSADDFAPPQTKKKFPRCRACAPNKFSNRSTGTGHQSRRESRRAQELGVQEIAGLVRNLREQVRYELLPAQRDPETGKLLERPVAYIADFVYEDCATGQTVVEDAKGMRTDTYILKRKLMLWFHKIHIREV